MAMDKRGINCRKLEQGATVVHPVKVMHGTWHIS